MKFLFLYIILTLIITDSLAQDKPKKSSELIGEKGILVSNKDSSSRVSKLLYNALVVNREARQDEIDAAVKDRAYMNQFEGRKIQNIIITSNNVAPTDSRLWADRTLNSLHYKTRERVIRKDLLFKSGDSFDPVIMMNNRQFIRARDYISDVEFEIKPTEADSMVVDVYVKTRDKWTISVDAGNGRNAEAHVKVFDDNILGTGNKLSVSTYFSWKKWNYGGNIFEYRMPNLFGTFFSGRFVFGHGFDRSDYGAEINKEFIKSRDYGAGAAFMRVRRPIRIYPEDTILVTSAQYFDIWAGKSFPITSGKSSLFFTGRFYDNKFLERPEVTADKNAFFHNDRMALASIGLYKERFRSATHIYGYSVKEYIAYGYRFTLNGGYSWGEFGDRWYLGGDFRAGYFTKIGYLGFDVALGSYLNSKDNRFYRTALVTNVNYFSPLMVSGRYRIRQFLNLNVTRGWNRLTGFRETLGFEKDYELRGMRTKLAGQNRMVLSTETVFFTPWNLYGFRVALFGFADFGLIGNSGNLFNNPLYSTVGVGVRIKNEKLIFSTISLRLGFAVSGKGFMDAEYFKLYNDDYLRPMRYIPEKATTVTYR